MHTCCISDIIAQSAEQKSVVTPSVPVQFFGSYDLFHTKSAQLILHIITH
jgi:hypothetical protein